MLREIVELQTNAVNNIVENLINKDEVTFKSPTGSGKTYMMADLMNKIISTDKDVVFLVSTLSKGDLAKQNYDKFNSYKQKGKFGNLDVYLINTDVSNEASLYIPIEHNVYILPRDLFKKNGKLMQGPMENFLNTLTTTTLFNGLNKKIYLIKDECHIATNNLDAISNSYFSKIINFSATPNLKRGQTPDVEITDEEAVNSKLIKSIEIGSNDDSVEDAIKKFECIKESYRNLLGVNPCLIIQISNKDKANDQINNIIMPILNKNEHQDLKWMLIVDKPNLCDSNDILKAKKLPVSKWKKYAKDDTSSIDIIIFKMVISEGWDIPRACMLYQVRDTTSEQLDEQVIGRVRRNPRLLDFEQLSTDAQKLATTAWIWGVMPKDKKKIYNVKLFDDYNDIQNNFKIKTTYIAPLTCKQNFNIDNFIDKLDKIDNYNSIFEMYKKLLKQDFQIQDMCYYYSTNYKKWFDFVNCIDQINQENNKYICNYDESMKVNLDENGFTKYVSISQDSSYIDNGNYLNVSDWIWKRSDGKDKISFDSEAEREWASILKDLTLSHKSNGDYIVKSIDTGKKNPKAGIIDIFGNIEPNYLSTSTKFLWAKNFIINSSLKFEYYLDGIHESYPDFIMFDTLNRIHIFEVKSVNISNKNINKIDSVKYKIKINALKEAYKKASLLTGYIFYLPVLKNDEWFITQLRDGLEFNISLEQFISFMRGEKHD